MKLQTFREEIVPFSCDNRSQPDITTHNQTVTNNQPQPDITRHYQTPKFS